MKNTKVRSWNINENKFFYFQNGRYFKDLECKICISERICSEFNWSNSEWFTSLKDKNGVEIYEGDIVRKDRLIPLIGLVTYQTESTRFWISIPRIGQKDDWTFIGSDCEVIGNIHSNPELLK